MGKFFSFVLDENANIYYIKAHRRVHNVFPRDDYDCHSYICQCFKLDEDRCVKCEWNPVNGFTVRVLSLSKCRAEVVETFIKRIVDSGEWDSICASMIKIDYNILQFVKNQTELICLEAVRKDGNALQFVRNQTESICLAAIKQNPGAFECVKDQTELICLEAVRKDGCTLQFVKEQTPEICVAAIRENSGAIRFVKNQTEKISFVHIKEQISENLFEERRLAGVRLCHY